MNDKWPVPSDQKSWMFPGLLSQQYRWQWSQQYAENGSESNRITGHSEIGFLWMIMNQAYEELRWYHQPETVDGKKLLK